MIKLNYITFFPKIYNKQFQKITKDFEAYRTLNYSLILPKSSVAYELIVNQEELTYLKLSIPDIKFWLHFC